MKSNVISRILQKQLIFSLICVILSYIVFEHLVVCQ